MRRPTMAPVPQQAYTQHTSGMTSTSEDEEGGIQKVQEVPRQTVKKYEKKDIGLAKIPQTKSYH